MIPPLAARLSAFLRKLGSARRSPRRARPRHQQRAALRVEELETRIVPATAGAPSFVTAQVNPNPAVFGTTVTISADAFPGSGPNPGSGPATTGSMTLLVNGVPSGTQLLVAEAATFTKANLAAGNYTFEMDYSGDVNYAPSSATIGELINKDPTVTSLTAAPNPATAGAGVVLTATVGFPGGIQPAETGAVRFFNNGNLLSTATLAPISIYPEAQATLTVANLPVGTNRLTANYDGDTNYLASATAAPFLETIDPGTPLTSMTALTATPNPSTLGQMVLLSAGTTTSNGFTATGSDQFAIDNAIVATVPLDANGNASFSTSALSVGAHALAVTFLSGSGNVANSSASLSQQVNTQSTTVVQTSGTPWPFGQTLTIVATSQAPGASDLSGIDQLTIDGVVVGTQAVGAAGTANFSVGTLTTGVHDILITYTSNKLAIFASSSSTFAQTIATASTTTLVSSANPSRAGAGVTFTATTTAADPSADVSGTDTFFIDGVVVGTASVGASGIAAFATSALSAGAHTVTVNYAGASGLVQASSASVAQTVNPVATTTTLTSSTNPSAVGRTVTFTASTTTATGLPATGSDQFIIDNRLVTTLPLDSNGNSTYSTATLTAGPHDVAVQFLSSTNNILSSSASLLVMVAANEKDTAAYWKKLADEEIAGYKTRLPAGASELDIGIERNKYITAAYAKAFLSDPSKFTWFGLAAYASNSVGHAIIQARSELKIEQRDLANRTVLEAIFSTGGLGNVAIGGAAGALGKYLGAGNLDVYNYIYWQYLAYKAGGIGQMNRLNANGDLTAAELKVWQLIDSNNPADVSTGNLAIFRHEQKNILQPHFDKIANLSPPGSEWLGLSIGQIMANQSTPVFPGSTSFKKSGGTDLTNFGQRWNNWIVKFLWPEWNTYMKNHPDRVTSKMNHLAKPNR